MTLLDMCKGLETTLSQLELARRGASDGAAIDQRLQQWNAPLGELRSARKRSGWLQMDLAQINSYPEQLERTRQLANEAADRLDANPDINSLTEQDLWVRLLQTTEKTGVILQDAIKERWRQQTADFQQLTPFHQLRSAASPVPQNDAPLRVYESNYSTAARIAGTESPRAQVDVDALANCVAACRSAAADLRFDAPGEVADFFRAVNAGGASMTLVTPAVLQWLSGNDQLSRYTVRGNSR